MVRPRLTIALPKPLYSVRATIIFYRGAMKGIIFGRLRVICPNPIPHFCRLLLGSGYADVSVQFLSPAGVPILFLPSIVDGSAL